MVNSARGGSPRAGDFTTDFQICQGVKLHKKIGRILVILPIDFFISLAGGVSPVASYTLQSARLPLFQSELYAP